MSTTPPPNQNTALTIARNPTDLMTFLTKAKPSIAMALPQHLNPERMVRLAVTCFSTTPALRNCTMQSILGSIIVASQIGLEPGIAGQGYLIPYKNTCTFVPGWQGLVGLLNNSGRATAWTGCVYEGDHWEFKLGSHPVCDHIPGPNFGDETKLTWVYACGKVNGSEQPIMEAWPMARVWKHRDKYNKVGDRHYSFQNKEMYARKVVLLQVLKYLPRSININNAITAINGSEEGQISRVAGDGLVINVESEASDGTTRVEFDGGEQGSSPTPPQGASEAGAGTGGVAGTQTPPVTATPRKKANPAPAPTPAPAAAAATPAPQTPPTPAQTTPPAPQTPPTPAQEPPAPDPVVDPAAAAANAAAAAADPFGAFAPGHPIRKLNEAGVTWPDFQGWLKSTGRCRNAEAIEGDGVQGYLNVPPSVWDLLLADTKSTDKCIKLYGKDQS